MRPPLAPAGPYAEADAQEADHLEAAPRPGIDLVTTDAPVPVAADAPERAGPVALRLEESQSGVRRGFRTGGLPPRPQPSDLLERFDRALADYRTTRTVGMSPELAEALGAIENRRAELLRQLESAPESEKPAIREQLERLDTRIRRTGRDAGYVDFPPMYRARAAALEMLDAGPAPRRALSVTRNLPAPRAFLDAIRAREAGDARAPAGVPRKVWDHAASLHHGQVNITSTDVEYYLATGSLPPVVDADGEVIKTGAQRMEELQSLATSSGEWLAVNTLTFLVRLRSSALRAESAQLRSRIELLPDEDPSRTEVTERIQAAEQLDVELARGLNGVFIEASLTRQAGHQRDLRRADRLERAGRRTEAIRLRDETLRAAAIEARYLEQHRSMPSSGEMRFVMAQANIFNARSEVSNVLEGRDRLRRSTFERLEQGGADLDRARRGGVSRRRIADLSRLRFNTLGRYWGASYDALTRDQPEGAALSTDATDSYRNYVIARLDEADAIGEQLDFLTGGASLQRAQLLVDRGDIYAETAQSMLARPDPTLRSQYEGAIAQRVLWDRNPEGLMRGVPVGGLIEWADRDYLASSRDLIALSPGLSVGHFALDNVGRITANLNRLETLRDGLPEETLTRLRFYRTCSGLRATRIGRCR
ncbi:MAG: hypothetical protein AAF658_06395 [Myxococcota bacterium]